MPQKTWKSVSKFRLFTMVGLSLLTSLSLSMAEELWTVKEIVSAVLQAIIAGFAYVQCPTMKIEDDQAEKTENHKL